MKTTRRFSPKPSPANSAASPPSSLPLPPSSPASSDPLPLPSPSPALLGVRNDLAEFGGSLKTTGLSLLSAAGISKLASNLLQARKPASEDDAGGHAPGIDDEILGFVAEISKLPDCWNGFPVPLDHHDFRMLDAQREREHALAVEELVLGFADVRVRVRVRAAETKCRCVRASLDPQGARPAHAVRGSSPSGSNDWVRLNKSCAVGRGHQRTSTSKEKDLEGEESNDWLSVDKFE